MIDDVARIDMTTTDDDDVIPIDMTTTDSDDVAMDDATYVVRSSSAIYMTITSEGSTVMTAHVFRGGAELSDEEVAMIGLIQWYINGSAAGTGKTLSVAASSVSSTSVYRARLEA